MEENRETLVYLFTGFLDSGKTPFIQEILGDSNFDKGMNTLLLVCEEGEQEYDTGRFASSHTHMVTVEDKGEITEEFLAGFQKKYDLERVIIECNGMWTLDVIYNALPEGWVVCQEMTFVDATTFMVYNTNMRNLVADKIKSTGTVVFKKFSRDEDKLPYHKIVRALNRRCDILYEYGPKDVEVDKIEDPLPFDMNADLIEVEDKDFAIWYADMNENETNYYGKRFKVKGRSLIGGGLGKGEMVFGRHVMTCCIEDIQFAGLVAKYENTKDMVQGGWVVATFLIKRAFHHMYRDFGPVLHVEALEHVEAPEEEVATFY